MKSPAFQFYPDSWLSSMDIALMTPAEEGAYVRLLCHAWLQTDCGLPTDDKLLGQLSRLGSRWEKSADKIKAKFVEHDGRLFNERLLIERDKQAEWSRKSSIGGKLSATKRQANHKGGSTVVEECLVPNGNSSSPSPSPSSEEHPQPPKGGVLDLTSPEPKRARKPKPEAPPESSEFQEFYAEYWRHEGRALAWAAYRKSVNGDHGRVMAALKATKPAMMDRDEDKRPHPSTWLNQKRWLDIDIPQVSAPSAEPLVNYKLAPTFRPQVAK